MGFKDTIRLSNVSEFWPEHPRLSSGGEARVQVNVADVACLALQQRDVVTVQQTRKDFRHCVFQHTHAAREVGMRLLQRSMLQHTRAVMRLLEQNGHALRARHARLAQVDFRLQTQERGRGTEADRHLQDCAEQQEDSSAGH